jgi:RNA polymerase sigma-70 factor (ECF subfamily)
LAFKNLYLKYRSDIYAYCLSLIKNEAFAEEVVQEVFLKVWVNRQDLNPELSFKAYIFTITRNLTFNFLNKAANEKDLHQQIFYKSQATANSVDHKMEEADLESIKRRAIESLPPKRRLIFEMSRTGGSSYEDISEELGISLSTVKNQMSKALSSLRKYLELNSDITTLIAVLFTGWLK